MNGERIDASLRLEVPKREIASIQGMSGSNTCRSSPSIRLETRGLEKRKVVSRCLYCFAGRKATGGIIRVWMTGLCAPSRLRLPQPQSEIGMTFGNAGPLSINMKIVTKIVTVGILNTTMIMIELIYAML